MTGNPNAQVVTEDSNQAQIADAIRCNGQMVQEATITETAVLTEQKHIHAQATEGVSDGASGGSEILGRASAAGSCLSSAKAVGANRASVYGDLAFEASGLGPIAQAGKMLTDAISDYKNPHAYGGFKTMDQVISDGASKPTFGGGSKSGKKDKIFTGKFNDNAAIPGRVEGVGNFTSSPLKGVKTTESTTAALSNKLQQTMSAKMLSQMQLGNAKSAEAKVGAKVAKAQQMGISPQALTHNGMGSGPTFVEPKEVVIDETATDWA